ncbi:PaaI family thioesterase [Chitinimonas sp.]|uniref:PaaI family thioesterase n=1 Tax=Chitinimonas sp. TaxID=1934313 RepID=UPI0035B38E18
MQKLSLPVANPALFGELAQWFCEIPHSRALGLEFVLGERGSSVMRVPYNTALVGNPRSGVLHGGVITSLIDTTSALSVISMLDEREAIATLDLRVDYLRAATPGEAVYCSAECYRLGRQIAFTRATVYQESNDQPIAHGVATFMRDSSNAQLGRSRAETRQPGA